MVLSTAARFGLLSLLGASTASAGLSRTTVKEEAAIKDAATECTYYDFPAVNAIASTFPTIWETADLSNAGIPSYVRQLFANISSGIPDIAPRGTTNGDFSNVTYDTVADPDCWWTEGGCTQPKLAGLEEDITICLEPNTWGFTLDDGPNCSHNAFYDYLLERKQKATMFYIGSNVLDWPLEAQRGLSDGHELCAHTWSHPYMTSLTNEQAFSELYFSKQAIKDVVGVTVQCWRPPFGDVDDRIRYIAQQLGMRTVLWSDDTDDWNFLEVGIDGVENNYKSIIANNTGKSAGVIVLTHEINAETMSLSEQFLPSIQKAYTGGVMPVAVCMNNTQPYVEGAAYKYPNYEQWQAGTRTISLAAPTAVSSNARLILAAETSSVAASSSSVSSAGAKGTSAAASSKSSNKAASSSSTSADTSFTTSAASSASSPSPTSGGDLSRGTIGVCAAGLALFVALQMMW